MFGISSDFEAHIGKHHSLTALQMPSIRDMCQKDVGRKPIYGVCPFCKETMSVDKSSDRKAAERAVRDHVSDHMEQLSFFVASSAGQMVFKDDDSEFQDDSDFEDGLQIEIKTIASKDTHMSKQEIRAAKFKAFMADQQKTAGDFSYQQSPGAKSPLETEVDPSTPSQGSVSGLHMFPLTVQLPRPSEHFYSRSNLILDLDKCLSSIGAMCIVHGVGGVGKTLAAVQYCHENRHRYDAIFWLEADTAPGLTDSYLKMAVALKVAENPDDHHLIIAKGRSWLQETGTYIDGNASCV